jgi:The GLUG motif
MKTILLALSFLIFNYVSAQTFEGRGSKSMQLGFGVGRFNTWYQENQIGLKGRFRPLSSTVSIQGEIGLGEYFSIGGFVGFNYTGNVENSSTIGYAFYNPSFYSFNIPVALVGNFHLSKVFDDILESNISDNTDIYAGMVIGGGPSFLRPFAQYGNLGSETGYMIFASPQLGIRYYPKSNFGFFLEMGYGKTYFNAGICFK